MSVLPLWSHRRVWGSLTFVTPRRPTPRQDRSCAALARLSSLLCELHSDAQRFIAAEELERKQAASLLHGVQAGLVAISHRIGECQKMLKTDPGRAGAVLGGAQSELDRTSEQDIHHVVRLLYPLIIRMSLAPALEVLAEAYRPRVDVSVRIEPAVAALDDPLDNRLPEQGRLVVYRTAQGALAHALDRGAGRVEILLTQGAGGDIMLTVRDDGRRRDRGRTEPQALLLRLHETGGTLRISRSRDGRTTVWASFPLLTTG